jgi:hypothetical protein
LDTIRNYFEQFLSFWGLDFSLSIKLYDLYLDFEKSNLEKFKRNNDEININYTNALIRNVYRKRLSSPHIDHDVVWKEYNKWEANKNELENNRVCYEESIKNINDLLLFNEKFVDYVYQVRAYGKNFDNFTSFLKKELPHISANNSDYIILYMERALEVLYDYPGLWYLYIEFTNDNQKRLTILKKATRCRYNSVILWNMLFNEMERQGVPLNQIEGNKM